MLKCDLQVGFIQEKKYVLAIIKTFSDTNNLNVLGSDNKGFFTQGLVVYFFHEGVRPTPISISHVFEKENNNSLTVEITVWDNGVSL